MAEHASHLTSAIDAGRPSIFQVLAQENLMMTVRPAGKHAVRVLAESRPERFGWLLQWYDEIYTLFDFVLQHHYLTRYSASFAENFYDLKRVCSENSSSDVLSQRAKWRSLVLLVVVPYLKQKLDLLFEGLKYREDMLPTGDNAPLKAKLSRAFLAVYPYAHLGWEGAGLYLMLAYTFQRSPCHSLPLRLSGTELRTSLEDEEGADQAQTAWEKAKSGGWLGLVSQGALQGTATLLSSGLSVGVFFLQFLDWWYNSDNNAPTLTALPVPKPPQKDTSESAAPDTCPLCQRIRSNETALSVSGYVFCFPCIHEYLQKHRCCPVTGYPAKTEHLIKIYQPES